MEVVKWISVTGSRYYPFTAEQWKELDSDTQLEAIAKGRALVHANLVEFPSDWGVVSGGAKGPDSWAEAVAHELGIQCVVYPAEWKRYGRGAGHRRNALIAEHADECLVFWDGESRGTNDFIRKAFDRRRHLFIVGPTGSPWAIYDEEFWKNVAEEKHPRMDTPRKAR